MQTTAQVSKYQPTDTGRHTTSCATSSPAPAKPSKVAGGNSLPLEDEEYRSGKQKVVRVASDALKDIPNKQLTKGEVVSSGSENGNDLQFNCKSQPNNHGTSLQSISNGTFMDTMQMIYMNYGDW